jgi:hypothetical protein
VSRFLIPLLCAFALAAQSKDAELPAEQRTGTIKRVLVLSHSHLDIGFTLPPDQVARDYKDNIDTAIRLARDNDDFRWTIESAWMLGEWLRRTDDERQIAELGRLLKEKRLSLGAAFGNMHSGLMGGEEMNRLVYLAESFRQRFGIQAEVAFQNDVPGFSWAYPRVLANSGVKYLVTGLNLFIGGGNNLGVAQTPFYWVGPDGSRVLTFFTYQSYVEGHRWKLSDRAPMEEMERTIPRRLAWLERNGYRYDTYLLMHSPGDNSDPMGAYRALLRIREWNRKHPELQMKMSSAEDFFEYVIANHGKSLTEARGDAAGHWELVKLGAPEASSRMRETASLLPATEGLATAATLLHGVPYPKFDFADAWRELLTYHEHTAGAGAGWPGYYTRWQTDWSNAAHYAAAMSGYSNTRQLFDKAVARLTGTSGIFDPAHKGSDNEATVLVYNGLSWPRGGPVVVSKLPRSLKEGPLEVVDRLSGQVLPCENVPGTERHLLFQSMPVPAMGYRLYSIRKGPAHHASSGDFAIEVKWNNEGWISSIRDSKTGIEAVDTGSETPFGGILVSGDGGEHERKYSLRPGTLAAAPAITDGPVSRRVEAARKDTPLRRTVVTLYRGAPYVDLAFEIDLRALPDDGLRYAIAFPIKSEQSFIDGAGMVYRVPQDLLPGGGAPQYTPVNFVHHRLNQEHGITLANRDAFLYRPDRLFLVAWEGLVTETRDEGKQRLFRTEPRGSNVQTFRFRLAIQGESKADWKKFGSELNLPLDASVIPGSGVAPERSFLAVTHPRVEVTAFKPAEHQPGWYVIRLQEIGGEMAENVQLVTPFQISEAGLANLVEVPTGQKADLSRLTVQPWQTLTILARIDIRRP